MDTMIPIHIFSCATENCRNKMIAEATAAIVMNKLGTTYSGNLGGVFMPAIHTQIMEPLPPVGSTYLVGGNRVVQAQENHLHGPSSRRPYGRGEQRGQPGICKWARRRMVCYNQQDGVCPYSHPSEMKGNKETNDKRKCKYGDKCRSYMQGRCSFNHYEKTKRRGETVIIPRTYHK